MKHSAFCSNPFAMNLNNLIRTAIDSFYTRIVAFSQHVVRNLLSHFFKIQQGVLAIFWVHPGPSDLNHSIYFVQISVKNGKRVTNYWAPRGSGPGRRGRSGGGRAAPDAERWWYPTIQDIVDFLTPRLYTGRRNRKIGENCTDQWVRHSENCTESWLYFNRI